MSEISYTLFKGWLRQFCYINILLRIGLSKAMVVMPSARELSIGITNCLGASTLKVTVTQKTCFYHSGLSAFKQVFYALAILL